MLIMLIAAILLINPTLDEGVSIKGVVQNSPAEQAGFTVEQHASPRNLEKIESINGQEINSLLDYYVAVNTSQLFIETNKGSYAVANATPTNGSLGLEVETTPRSNIRTGIELSGGVRILLEPERELESSEINTMRSAIEKRLNVFGLADISVRYASGSTDYFVVEMATNSLSQVEDLLSKQGQFEAKITNQTAYTGDDILEISKDPLSGAGVVTESCGPTQDGFYGCQYQFPVTLSGPAARNMADLTRNLTVISGSLSAPLQLFLDGVLVNELSVAASLKGRAVQDIQISGFATGTSRADAINNAKAEMVEFMGLLESGNLPAKLEIVKADRLSPKLGASFIDNALWTSLACLIFVGVIMYVRYRSFAIAIPAIITVIAEVILLLGFAALSGWNLDVASIAGFIIILGTGLDHLIIITDETRSKTSTASSLKGKLKQAFRVIMTAFFTTVVAMIPLYSAGAGLLQGFATTTIIGLIIAIFITRPAFGAMLEWLLPQK